MNVEEYKLLAAKNAKRGKYNNVASQVDGFRFDSKREGMKWLQLRQWERSGEISNLRRQVVFPLVVNGVLVAKYRADFTYDLNGKSVIEDVKGVKTDAYRLKRNLMLAIHGIEILET